MKKGIIGAGGFGREVFWSLSPIERNNTVFFVNDEYWDNSNPNILPLSLFETDKYELVVAIGDPYARKMIIESLPKKTKFFTHIHPSVQILGDDIEIGRGSIICAGSVLTTNIKIGEHAHLNLQTTIGHDTTIGDFFTTAPGAKISGNCKIGDRVYVGTNASIREKIEICDDVTIGLNAGVVKNIYEQGVYGGTPCKKIK
jgi:sugar O-acyltransferase (sialic acid O-acetyltransferase NeuD family)